jgi:hypothetical protein
MNETNLEDTVLSDEDDAVVTSKPEPVAETPAVDQSLPAGDAVEDPDPKEEEAPKAAVKRSGAGRKVDVTGTTALGYARILYRDNPGLDTKQLKALFTTELAKFGSTPNVIQTYVSMVRSKPKAKKSP